MGRFSTSCIYTVKNSAELAGQFESGGEGTHIEYRGWPGGERLLHEAVKNGVELPIVFASIDLDYGLTYWAIVESIEVDRRRTQTACRYSALQRLDPVRPRSTMELLPRRRGRRRGRIEDSDIRPYRLCRTPGFITSARVPLVAAGGLADGR